ncbi:superoxide dismutase family protein [Halotalea alkalilenta]|uniref:superoxide dismutase family protein n=1 Tax=Halotalea alkalilenta TaxID=376489 RepID=UPI0004880796|nr:superoxide dismutase family protein [Halotalea alkalilenta]
MKYLPSLLCAAALTSAPWAMAAVEVDVHRVSADGVGDSIGTVTFENTQYGLLITPDLSGLDSSIHGLHLHTTPSCEPGENDAGEVIAAGAAGAHYDPDEHGTHQGPYVDDSHLGDLPALAVAEDGTAQVPTLAPRLEESDLYGRALMVHAGGDNYSDHPTLGGGGGRFACGVIPAHSPG